MMFGCVDSRSSGEIDRWGTDYLLTPWCRAGPFIIGMALGIILHHKRKFKMHLVRLHSFCLTYNIFIVVIIVSVIDLTGENSGWIWHGNELRRK